MTNGDGVATALYKLCACVVCGRVLSVDGTGTLRIVTSPTPSGPPNLLWRLWRFRRGTTSAHYTCNIVLRSYC